MSTEVTLSTKNLGLEDKRVVLSVTGILQFKVGMKIEVDYVNPTAGWFVIWLVDNDDNVVLTFSARIERKHLIISTKDGREWGPGESVDGYDFTPGASQNVLLEAEQDYFIIRVNNVDLYHYKHKLPPTSIHRIIVNFQPHDFAAAPQLKAVSYKY